MVVYLMIMLALSLQAAKGANVQTASYYYVVPIESTQLCQSYPNGTCFILDELWSSVNASCPSYNITVSFLPGDHSLSLHFTVENIRYITFKSEFPLSANPTIHCVNNVSISTGFEFIDIVSVHVSNLNIFDCRQIDTGTGGAIFISEASNVIIENCSLSKNFVSNMNGIKSHGGAVSIENADSIVIESCTFVGNAAFVNVGKSQGGALYVANISQNCTILNTYFYFNKAYMGGGLAWNNASLYIFGSTFLANNASMGGGIYTSLGKTLSMFSSLFSTNNAINNGGAVCLNPPLIEEDYYFSSAESVYEHNTAADYGGALYSLGFIVITNTCQYINNTAYSGSALYISQNLFNSSHNIFYGNSAKFAGAVFTYLQSAVFYNDSFLYNSAQKGAASYQQFMSPSNFTSCQFVNNTSLQSASGVVYISDSQLFISGECSFILNYGPLQIVSSKATVLGHVKMNNNTNGAISCSKSDFIVDTDSVLFVSQNKAEYGGGMFLNRCNLLIYSPLHVVNNVATFGGGVYSYESGIICKIGLTYPSIFLPKFSNNTATQNGGGLYLTGSNIVIDYFCYFHIDSNTAQLSGGGLYLNQYSKILLTKSASNNHMPWLVELVFSNNSATTGGGVYISDINNAEAMCTTTKSVDEPLRLSGCFIQTLRTYPVSSYKTNGINFVNTFFNNNEASITGKDIYGGFLDRCTIYSNAEYYLSNKTFGAIEYILNTVQFDGLNFTEPFNKSKLSVHISSAPLQLCFCFGENVVCNSTYNYPNVTMEKGGVLQLRVVAVNQIGDPMSGTVITSFSKKSSLSRLKEGQEYQHIENCCTDLLFNVYSNVGAVELILFAEGPCTDRGISRREVSINFSPCICPIGFEDNSSPIDCKCGCDKRLIPYIINCYVAHKTIEIKNIWVDFVNNSDGVGFVISSCPFDYCVKGPVNISFESLDEECANNRSGVLCGECQQGLSLVFSSSRCIKCSNYYLFLVIPFGLLGVLLVVFILMLNMTVTEGTINGLVLYANILAANGSIFLPFELPNFLTVFISWINLDFGIESCFFDGMDSYVKLMLQLAFPIYLLFLISLIIFLSEKSTWFTSIISRRKPVPTLCTLILLSYSKLLRMIVASLQFRTLYYSDQFVDTVWLYDGNVMYTAAKHIPRFIIALIILLLGILYTSLLLFWQPLNQFSNCLKESRPRLSFLVKWVNHPKYATFIQEHHAPLVGKHRYWTGLLLLTRIVHHLVSAFAQDDVTIFMVGMLMFMLLLVKFLIYCSALYKHWPLEFARVYNKWQLDVLQTSFLVNLIIFAFATFYVHGNQENQKTIAYVSMAYSFIAFSGVIIYHLSAFRVLKSARSKLCSYFHRFRINIFHKVDPNEYQRLPQDSEEDNNSEVDYHMHEELNTDSIQLYVDGNGDSNAQDNTTYQEPIIIRPALPPHQLREEWMDDLLGPPKPEDYKSTKPRPCFREQEMRTCTEIDIR